MERGQSFRCLAQFHFANGSWGSKLQWRCQHNSMHVRSGIRLRTQSSQHQLRVSKAPLGLGFRCALPALVVHSECSFGRNYHGVQLTLAYLDPGLKASGRDPLVDLGRFTLQELSQTGFSSEIQPQADGAPLEGAVSANLVERKSCVYRLHVEPSTPSNCRHSRDSGEMIAQIGRPALPRRPE